jgi:ketosteroid isomerase-like protein
MMNPEATALAYLDAVATKDLGRLETLVTPDVQFTGPASQLRGLRDVRAAFERITPIQVRSDIKRVFSDGNDVCVIYDFVTDTAGALPTIEWLTLANGRIASIKLYYDQVPWLKIREELARRAKA